MVCVTEGRGEDTGERCCVKKWASWEDRGLLGRGMHRKVPIHSDGNDYGKNDNTYNSKHGHSVSIYEMNKKIDCTYDWNLYVSASARWA